MNISFGYGIPAVDALLQEIRTTGMSTIKGRPKFRKAYKMIMLLGMLDTPGRGPHNWWTRIRPADIALFFHHILTHYPQIREIQFSDKDKQAHQSFLNDATRRFVEDLIRKNPMFFWGNKHRFGKYDASADAFYFDIDPIPPTIQQPVYEEVRRIALSRIQNECMPGVPLPADFYDFSERAVKADLIAEHQDGYDVGDTEKELMIKARVGQSKFRTLLLERYPHCFLCQLAHPKLLTASHIKRWSDSTNKERVDLDNALLLCPVHDRLFDKWLISFDADGTCMVNPRFRTHPDARQIALPKTTLIPISERNQRYLAFHREKFFSMEAL